jgi:hypothetical protein
LPRWFKKECGKSQEAISRGKKEEKSRPEASLPIVNLKKWGREIRMKSLTSSFAMAAGNLDGEG